MKTVIISFLSVIVCLIAGCTNTGDSHGAPSYKESSITVNNSHSFSVKEIDYLQKLHNMVLIPEEGRLIIFDIDERRILYALQNTKNERTSCVGIFDYLNAKILWETQIEEDVIYIDGILLNQGAAFSQIAPVKGDIEQATYLISIVSNNVLKPVDSGLITNIPTFFPYLSTLKGNLIYSYYSIDSKNQADHKFGIRILTSSSEINSLAEFSSNSNHRLLSNELISNGSEYMYFFEEDGKGTFLTGDSSGIIERFELPPGRKIISYDYLKNGILFSFIVSPDNIINKRKVSQFESELWYKEKGKSIEIIADDSMLLNAVGLDSMSKKLSSFAGNHNSAILASDYKGKTFIVFYKDSEVSIVPLDDGALKDESYNYIRFHFFPISDSRFIGWSFISNKMIQVDLE